MKKRKNMLDIIVDIKNDQDIIDLWNLYQTNPYVTIPNFMPDNIDPFVFKPLLKDLKNFALWVENHKKNDIG